jgi:type VI secretion system Hcp family effector
MPIYMQYDGITGSVTTKGHEKWIELLSCSFRSDRAITSANGRGTNRESSAVSVGELMISKYLDCATSSLLRANLSGDGRKVKIDYCKTDKDKWETYLQLELENALVSSFCTSGGDSSDRPVENLNLNFTKITWVTTLMDDKNSAGKPDRGMYDLAQGSGG